MKQAVWNGAQPPGLPWLPWSALQPPLQTNQQAQPEKPHPVPCGTCDALVQPMHQLDAAAGVAMRAEAVHPPLCQVIVVPAVGHAPAALDAAGSCAGLGACLHAACVSNAAALPHTKSQTTCRQAGRQAPHVTRYGATRRPPSGCSVSRTACLMSCQCGPLAGATGVAGTACSQPGGRTKHTTGACVCGPRALASPALMEASQQHAAWGGCVMWRRGSSSGRCRRAVPYPSQPIALTLPSCRMETCTAVDGGRGAGKLDAGLGQRGGRGELARGGGCGDGLNDGFWAMWHYKTWWWRSRWRRAGVWRASVPRRTVLSASGSGCPYHPSWGSMARSAAHLPSATAPAGQQPEPAQRRPSAINSNCHSAKA